MTIEPAAVLRILERCAARSLDDEVDRAAVAILVAQDLSRGMQHKDVSLAQRDAALDQLEQITRYVQKTGGFMFAEDQAMLRGARALLAEMGRKL
jgi:hypothetical protein